MTQPAASYRDDLAYIHDTGFGAFARLASPWLLELFRARHLNSGRVIDLGCGSGIWAEACANAGYELVGYDLSAAMIALAGHRVPKGEFHCKSFLDAPLPTCVAVTAIGEIFNYLFDSRNTPQRLATLFRRVHKALVPGGLFVFDVATPGRAGGGKRRGYTVGAEWACLFEADEDVTTRTLTRRITSFRKAGASYRRDDEVHRLRLYDRADLLTTLRDVGFRVRTVRAYGETRFPAGYVGFVARKI